jgi:5-enolpyruvylshikimate-3-phosphate synthase
MCDTLKISGSKRVVIWLRRSVKGEKIKINADLSSSTFFVRKALPGQRLGLGHAL